MPWVYNTNYVIYADAEGYITLNNGVVIWDPEQAKKCREDLDFLNSPALQKDNPNG